MFCVSSCTEYSFKFTTRISVSPKTHYENLPMQYTEIFQDVKLKFSLEKFRFVLYFRSKQTLWGHGMGSARRF